MDILVLILVMIVLFAVFIKTHSRHRFPARIAVANMLLGTVTLAGVSVVFSVTVNFYTTFLSLTLGVPGVLLSWIL